MPTGQQTRTFRLPGLLLFGALGLAAGPAAAVDYYLAAKPFDMTMPDGTTVPMWGYVEDPGGACYATTGLAARLACITALPSPTVPGPKLTVAPAEAGNALRVFLSNGLPAPTSIVIPGQEMPFTALNNNGPTWLDGTTGPRPSASARVRSFGREAAANGGRQVYIWNNFRGNPFQAGTYTYQSGTHPQVQVQMGLYGAAVRDAAAGEAYPGVPYAASHDLYYSEVDPVLHEAVATGAYGTPPAPTSTRYYSPKYFLLHGYDIDGLPIDLSIDPANSDCFAAGTEGERVLLRLYNAGLRELAPLMIGSHVDVVAEGGRVYGHAQRQYQTLLMPGSTRDIVFTPGYAGDFAILERRLSLTDAAEMNGGMQTCLAVAPAGGNTAPIANAGGPYGGIAGLPIAFDGSGSSDPDGDPLGYSWDFGDGATGTGTTPSHAYAAPGVYTVTLTVNDGTVDSAPANATATVAVNQAPTAAANGPYTGKTGFAVAFDGAASSDPEGQPLAHAWDFGDGNTGTGAAPSHAYAAAGVYTVTLTVNDGHQDSAPATTSATVTDNTAPVANAGGPYASNSTTITFDGTASSDADGDPLTYSWNFGDGNTGTGPTPTHTYVQGSGTSFVVTLVVNDGYADSAPATTNATLTGSPGNTAPVAANDAYNPDDSGGVGNYAVAAPGVLANDTDADGDSLTAQLVTADEDLRNFVLNPDGSFSYGPMEKVGTFPFTYQAFDGTDASGIATANVTREIRVTKAEYVATSSRWRVEGRSSAIGSTVSVFLGPDTGGTLLGTAVVGANGAWTFDQSNHPTPGFAGVVVSVDVLSTPGGAVLGRSVVCRGCL
ncbi:hypothetical protein SVA_3514 [Sulfurifustis variabilis]|uniref:PKD domain-containing protein n=1 Tax=Sulfurifustis variabilis TaxID=1675686 RepID=A0A1C7AFF9_9GAMM|nr:PKD domain-containing protein [Sulfurifustis variabilis]BAU50050.1 hypothetical protein SVA_3514 [Sulfurifustis variabilis]